MSNVIRLIHHSIDGENGAKDCKESFGDDYEMYCSWLESLVVTRKNEGELERCKIVPQPYEVYISL